jgi:hypothetical protein
MAILLQVIPITDAMREPRKFPAALSGVMIFLMCEHTRALWFPSVQLKPGP